MSKVTDVNAETQMPNNKVSSSKIFQRRGWEYLLDAFIVLVMAALLFWGAASQFSNQYNDATRYQCYAVAFWHGTPGLASLPTRQCTFLQASSSSALAQKMQARGFPSILVSLVESQSTSQPLHTLPPEYPFLTLVPFSLALLAPQQSYQAVFALLMALVAGIIYFVLKRSRSTSAAIAFAAYLVIGSWATAESRFDLVTAALTLGAVILAGKARWKWAFSLLALATLLKFYPIVLVPPLLIAQQKQSSDQWNSWRRWQALALFAGICTGVTALSLLLNVADTLNAFRYFFDRPIEVESFPGTLLWLGHFVGYPLQYVVTFQSLNFLSPLSSKISLLSTLLLGVGLLYTFWLQWRGKLDFFTASLLTLLVVMTTSKVFSPQYLIWVTPLIAYVGKANWKWLVSWGMVGALTTLVFPFNYVDLAHIIKIYPAIFIRDLIVLAIVVALLWKATRTPTPSSNRQAVQAESVNDP